MLGPVYYVYFEKEKCLSARHNFRTFILFKKAK